MAIEEVFRDENPRICVVLGGRCFIGRSLVSKLLKSEDWIVRIADTAPSLNLDFNEKNSVLYEAISSGRASYFQVDVREKSQISRAINGSSVVFHMDANDSSLSDFYLQYMITVQGTKNVINVCRECKVKRLIYNSSADVVFDGLHDIHNGDDSLPYPWRFEDMLSDLKAQAEALVLFANTDDGLLTCALRPSNAFGPGDTHLVPFLLSAAKSGWSKFIVGNGENMCDFTFIDNIAHAHVCAEEALRAGITSAAGKAFFITNLEPIKFWEFVSLILEGLGYQSPTIQLPSSLVWFILVLVNWVRKKLGHKRNAHSILTPALVHVVSLTRTFNCSKAQNHIGYSPIVSLEEGVTLTIKSFSHLAKDSPFSRYRDLNEPSTVEKLLGSGGVADILLWRDERQTFTYFSVLALLFYWFFLSGRTFISSTAKLLQMISVVLFVHGILPSSLFGFTVKKISPAHFDVSESVIKDALISLASAWNQCVQMPRSFAQGGDWNIFFKVAVSLYFLKQLLSFSFSSLIGMGLVSAFTAFFIYEQYEGEVDRLTKASSIAITKLKELLIKNLPVSILSFLRNYVILDQDEGGVMVKNQNTTKNL